MHCPINSMGRDVYEHCGEELCAWYITEVEQCAFKFLAYYFVDCAAERAMRRADELTDYGRNDPGE